MISVSEAVAIIDRETPGLEPEAVGLAAAPGRFLAEEIAADFDQPRFDRSQMDGYAVIASDTSNAPVKLTVVGESAAGNGWDGTLARGECVRIMTGARVPKGADAVQKIELCNEDENGRVQVLEPVLPDRFIIRRGTEVKAGTGVLRPGLRLTANSLAVAAAFGHSHLRVGAQPKVAIMATGSEIIPISSTPGTDHIRDSNSIMLFAHCSDAGAKCTMRSSTVDDLTELVRDISKLVSDCDMLITTGGVSVGKYDLTKAALAELGGEIYFDRVRVRPGKPMIFARIGKTLVFSLPGNPVSAAVTWYLFVRRSLLRMQGANEPGLKCITAATGSPMKGSGERETYLPVLLSSNGPKIVADPIEWHGSSDLVGFARSQGLAIIPAGIRFKKDSEVQVLTF